MKELKTSGLPIYYNEKGILELNHDLTIQGTNHKTVKDMAGLLMKPNSLPENEICYSTYRGIMRPSDIEVFDQYNKRYDITVIMENPAIGECKKTSGHFHAFMPGKKISYPEVYEVLLGTAIYILVKLNDHLLAEENLVVEDIRIVTVEAGETIVIPPNYGHAAINAGAGPMVFNNICTLENKSDYSLLEKYHGMPYYITKENGKLTFVRNINWPMHIPDPRMMHVQENADIGILFNNPVYHEFLKRPSVFNFLENPVGHEGTIMEMLTDIKSDK